MSLEYKLLFEKDTCIEIKVIFPIQPLPRVDKFNRFIYLVVV